ncbi:MAG: glycosyltransferase family 39 protein [Chloroflexota bacterium]
MNNTPPIVSALFSTQYSTSEPPPARWRIAWWTAFVAILIAGLLLAGTGYRHGLPFVDTGDEMTIWTMGRAYLDPSWNMFQPDQPPALLWVSEFIQRIQIAAGDPYINVGKTVEVMRLLSVILDGVALAIIMLLARRLAGIVAGIAAGLFWATLPMANELAKLSTHNLYVSAFFIAAIAAGIEGWYRKSLRWIALSLVLAMLSTLFKWQGAAALGIAGLACLTFWNTDRRKMLVAMAVYGVIVALFSYWVIVVHGALRGDAYLPGVKAVTPTPTVIFANLQYLATQIGPGVIFAVLPLAALVIAALIPKLRRRLYGAMGLWSLLLVIVVFAAILSFYGAPVFDRHYLPAMTLLAVLAGMGLSLLLQVILTLKRVGILLAILLLIVVSIPMLHMATDSRQIALLALRPDRRNSFAEWARTTATDGALLITNPNLAIAVQSIWGYRGRYIETPYNDGLSVSVKLEDITADKLIAKNIRYIVANEDLDSNKIKLPLTRIIRGNFDADQDFNGPKWGVWYVGALPTVAPDPLAIFGNELLLRGYSLSKTTVCPGESVDLQMLWSAQNRPSRYYSVYVHLHSAQTNELSEPINGDLPANADRPTISWANPDEILIGAHHVWTVRPDLPTGDYELWLGVFEPVSDHRLQLPTGKDHHILAKLHVVDCTSRQPF